MGSSGARRMAASQSAIAGSGSPFSRRTRARASMGARRPRVAPDRLGIIGDRLVAVALFSPGVAPADHVVHVPGIAVDQDAEVDDRLAVFAAGQEEVPSLAIGDRSVRVEPDHLAEVGDRLVGSALDPPGGCAGIIGIGILRGEPDRPRVVVDGLVVLPQIIPGGCAAIVMRGLAVIELDTAARSRRQPGRIPTRWRSGTTPARNGPRRAWGRVGWPRRNPRWP